MIFFFIFCDILKAKKEWKEGLAMLDRTGDWCFEGGCTYLRGTAAMMDDEPDSAELEAMYREPCIGMYD